MRVCVRDGRGVEGREGKGQSVKPLLLRKDRIRDGRGAAVCINLSFVCISLLFLKSWKFFAPSSLKH